MRAPVAQLDRASASGVEGRGFKSRRVHHFFCCQSVFLCYMTDFFLPGSRNKKMGM